VAVVRYHLPRSCPISSILENISVRCVSLHGSVMMGTLDNFNSQVRPTQAWWCVLAWHYWWMSFWGYTST